MIWSIRVRARGGQAGNKITIIDAPRLFSSPPVFALLGFFLGADTTLVAFSFGELLFRSLWPDPIQVNDQDLFESTSLHSSAAGFSTVGISMSLSSAPALPLGLAAWPDLPAAAHCEGHAVLICRHAQELIDLYDYVVDFLLTTGFRGSSIAPWRKLVTESSSAPAITYRLLSPLATVTVAAEGLSGYATLHTHEGRDDFEAGLGAQTGCDRLYDGISVVADGVQHGTLIVYCLPSCCTLMGCSGVTALLQVTAGFVNLLSVAPLFGE
ncbi:hypothetical protein C8J57DRAFT_1519024 [Mycena rebaudengoi]|nr:hypothetical protein C8J57DRAFT_1523961 [Mycena rebaudengoi]KAJ7253860.1 hypothetical protein C8J57DRAFT_1519024 [Mycena rebaudengoi]